MRSLSSNLLKRGYTCLAQDDLRVIDSNERMARRMEELTARMQRPENEGFVPGLQAGEVPPLEEGEENSQIGNVIKAAVEDEAASQQAKAEADLIVQQAKEEAETLRQQAISQAKQEKRSILEQARAQGYEEGQRKAQAEKARLEQEYREKENQLEDAYQKKIDELEPAFIDTITGVYEHIFHVELASYREVLVYLISAAMRDVEEKRSFLIHVSKEDYPYVSMEKKQLTAVSPNSEIEIIEDLTLGKNDCLIETDGGIFDCGVGTQLAQLRQKLKLLSYEK